MSLEHLLKLSEDKNIGVQEITEEVLLENIDEIRELIAFYREYPDIFVDDIKGEDCVFTFRPTQRLFLRNVMRHKYVYAVFPRGGLRSQPVFLLIAGKSQRMMPKITSREVILIN